MLFVSSLIYCLLHDYYDYAPAAYAPLLRRDFTLEAIPMGNTSSTAPLQQGWISAPARRGTLTILYSCFTTLFLCVWTVHHPNVPRFRTTTAKLFLLNLGRILLGIVLPERYLHLAWKEWVASRRLFKEVDALGPSAFADGPHGMMNVRVPDRCQSHGFNETTTLRPSKKQPLKLREASPLYRFTPPTWRSKVYIWKPKDQRESVKTASDSLKDFKWTMQKSFFIVAGGLCVDSSSFYPQEQITFTARGVLELAKSGLLPTLGPSLVQDKSKADAIAKTLVFLQAGWFLVQFSSRILERLPLTLLEIHTVAHVLVAALTYVWWWHKPKDMAFSWPCPDEQVKDFAAFLAVDQPYLSTTRDGKAHRQNLLEKRESYAGRNDSKVLLCTHDKFNFCERSVRASHQVPLGSVSKLSGTRGTHVKSAADLLRSAIVHPILVREHQERANRALRHVHKRGQHICFYQTWSSTVHGPVISFERQQYLTTQVSSFRSDGEFSEDEVTVRSRMDSFNKWRKLMSLTVSSIYGVFHLAAWSYRFPTPVELWMWRVAALIAACLPLFAMIPRHTSASHRRRNGTFRTFAFMLAMVMRVFRTLFVLGCTIFVAARLFLLVESLMSLRLVPDATFDTTDWTAFVPHIS